LTLQSIPVDGERTSLFQSRLDHKRGHPAINYVSQGNVPSPPSPWAYADEPEQLLHEPPHGSEQARDVGSGTLVGAAGVHKAFLVEYNPR
jgi:hypothetical protein